MKRVLVTGSNKGIGLAIVTALLERGDVEAILCARNAAKGEEARQSLIAKNADFASRLTVETLDVCDATSVSEAAARQRALGPLFGLVNNAGIAFSAPQAMLDTNLFGVKAVTEAFLDNIETGGRVVMMSSGAAVMFLEKCSETKKELYTSDSITWDVIEDHSDVFMQLLLGPNGAEACESAGFGKGDPSFYAYGFSKCMLNAYTVHLAKTLKADARQIAVNACSPGMIATDLFIPMAAEKGKTLEEMTTAMNALPPSQGTVSTIHLLFGENDGRSGYYFGSDGKRSPMAKYRSPGTEEYDGVAHGR